MKIQENVQKKNPGKISKVNKKKIRNKKKKWQKIRTIEKN